MAEHLNGLLRIVSMLALCMAVLPCRAEALPDPTRPVDAGAAQTSASGADGEPVLQLIRISKTRKASAVIDGQSVQVGDSFDGARVVVISEAKVVLKSGNVYKTLNLFPGVEKNPSKRKAK